MYEYQGVVLDIIDGDSLRLDIDLGLSIRSKQVVRLRGIDAPEMVGPTHEAGVAAKMALSGFVPVGARVLVRTHKDKREKWGRYLADVWPIGTSSGVTPIGDKSTFAEELVGRSASDFMLASGHAVAYDGGKR